MLNTERLWNGANAVTGGIWYPAIFDRGQFQWVRIYWLLKKLLGNASNNPSLNEPLLQGSIMVCP